MRVRGLITVVALVAALGPVSATAHAERWVSAWGSALHGPYPVGYNFDDTDALPGGVAADQTLRMVVRPTLGGRQVRVRLSNATGASALRAAAVTVGVRGAGAALLPGSVRAVTFGGLRQATVAPGRTLLSDPVGLAVRPLQELAVSVHLPLADRLAWHALGLVTGYVGAPGGGDATTDETGAAYPTRVRSMFVVDGIDVLAPGGSAAVVAFGDSLTDGQGAGEDGYDRWTDALVTRLAGARLQLGVVNTGIGGNNLGRARGIATDGPAGLDRLDRDVLERSGVRAVVLAEGSNDLSNNATTEELIADLREAAGRLHDRGLHVVGATMLPRGDDRWTTAMERRRLDVNAWIRAGSAFDQVADFEAAVAAPDGALDPRYDSGDHLHPNPAGYARIAATVDLGHRLGLPCTGVRRVAVRVPSGLRDLRATVGSRPARVRRIARRRVRVLVPAGAFGPVRLRLKARRADGRPHTISRRVLRCEEES